MSLKILFLDDNPASAITAIHELIPETTSTGIFRELGVTETVVAENILPDRTIRLEILIPENLNNSTDAINFLNEATNQPENWNLILVDNHWGDRERNAGVDRILPFIAQNIEKPNSSTQIVLWTKHWGSPDVRRLYEVMLLNHGELLKHIRGVEKDDIRTLQEVIVNTHLIQAEPREVEHSSEVTESLVEGNLPEAIQHFIAFPVKRYLEAPGHGPLSFAKLLILGETGVGKSHFLKHRFTEELTEAIGERNSLLPFEEVNCANFSEPEKMRQALFGTDGKSFTGVNGVIEGAVPLAKGGILFLDEIDKLTVDAQRQLLTFLDDGQYKLEGDNKTMYARCILVLATNANLEKLVQNEQMIPDFLYRVHNSTPHKIPPLRNRPSDLPLIINSVYKKMMNLPQSAYTPIDQEAVEYLKTQPLPGNVRAIEATLARCEILYGKEFSTRITRKMIENAYAKVHPTRLNTTAVETKSANSHQHSEVFSAEKVGKAQRRLEELERLLSQHGTNSGPELVADNWVNKRGKRGLSTQALGKKLWLNQDGALIQSVLLNPDNHDMWQKSKDWLTPRFKFKN